MYYIIFLNILMLHNIILYTYIFIIYIIYIYINIYNYYYIIIYIVIKTGQCHIYVTFNLSCRPAALQNEGAGGAELGGPTHPGGREDPSSSSSQHAVVMERDGEDVHSIKKLHLRGIYRI